MAFGQPFSGVVPPVSMSPVWNQALTMPQHPVAAAVQKPKFFGQGGAGRSIAGFIGDALLQMSGHPAIYAAAMERQQQAAAEEEQYQRHRAAELEDKKAYRQFETDNPTPPQPTEYERALTAAGIQPGTTEYQQHMSNYVGVKENPPRFMEVPGVGLVQLPSGVSPPARPVGKLTPLGAGGPASGPGNFR